MLCKHEVDSFVYLLVAKQSNCILHRSALKKPRTHLFGLLSWIYPANITHLVEISHLTTEKTSYFLI